MHPSDPIQSNPLSTGRTARPDRPDRADAPVRRERSAPGQDAGASRRSASTDRIDLSPEAKAMHATSRADNQPIRSSLVTRVRGEIDAGAYETDRKIDIVVDRVIRDLERM